MSRYDLVINGISYIVEILSVAHGQATVGVNGVTYQVQLPSGTSALQTQPQAPAVERAPAPPAAPAPSVPKASARPAQKPAVAQKGEPILAPMPGHIVNVMVKEGDTVSSGTTLMLMEAMKMENEIKSHVAGKVVSIQVEAGQTVGVNDVLAVIGE